MLSSKKREDFMNRTSISFSRYLKTSSLIYAIIILMRSANAGFIISLTFAYPNLSTALQGLIQAAYSFTEASLGLLSGIMYEIVGAGKSMIISSSLLAFSYLFMMSASLLKLDPYVLVIPSATAGLSASFLISSSLATVAEQSSFFSSRSRIFGVGGIEVSNLLGYGLGFTFAGLFELVSMEAVKLFIPSVIVSLLAMLLSVALGWRRLLEKEGLFRVAKSKIKIEKRVLYLVPMWSAFAFILGVAFLTPKIISELSKNYNLGISTGGSFISGMLVVAILGLSAFVLIGTYITSIIGKKKSLIVGTFSSIGLFSILAYATATSLSQTEFYVLACISAILTTLSLTLPSALLALLADYTDVTRIRGPSSGVYVSSLGFGMAFGESLGGKIFDIYSLSGLFATVLIIFVPLSFITIYLVSREEETHPIKNKTA